LGELAGLRVEPDIKRSICFQVIEEFAESGACQVVRSRLVEFQNRVIAVLVFKFLRCCGVKDGNFVFRDGKLEVTGILSVQLLRGCRSAAHDRALLPRELVEQAYLLQVFLVFVPAGIYETLDTGGINEAVARSAYIARSYRDPLPFQCGQIDEEAGKLVNPDIGV